MYISKLHTKENNYTNNKLKIRLGRKVHMNFDGGDKKCMHPNAKQRGILKLGKKLWEKEEYVYLISDF